MIARQWLALIIERDHRLPRCEIRERDVGGVSVVAVCERKGSGRVKPSVSEKVVDGYALPCGVEFRPRGYAVDVARHLGSWESVELRPVPHLDRARSDLQRESPIGGFDPRRRAGRQ